MAAYGVRPPRAWVLLRRDLSRTGDCSFTCWHGGPLFVTISKYRASRDIKTAFRCAACGWFDPASSVQVTWGWYHGGRRPSSDDSFHSPTVIPPSAPDKPSITKRYHRRRTCSHISPRRSPMVVTLHDTRFVECRWWNDGWTVKVVVT